MPERPLPRFRRLPWVPIAITALVLVSALFAVSPIRDAATRGAAPEVQLIFPGAYLLLAPLCDALDTLSLLTVGQHVAVLVSVLVLVAAWRWWRRRGAPARPIGRAIAAEGGWLAGTLAGLAIVYAFGAMAPRPMAQLAVGPVDILAVDMHAHTDASHDGRKGWDVEKVRAWHRAAGFDAVYVADHRSMKGAEDGWVNNPQQAGEGVSILPALEAVWDGAHVNMLSMERAFNGLTTPDLRDVDSVSLRMASLVAGKEPVLVQTFPDAWKDVKPNHGRGTAGVRAIEIVDGAPRGLSQVRRDHDRILAFADSFNLALVAGSNNHGWGRTAPGWTLFRIPTWRGMTPDSLANEIETILREGGRGGTRVVERTAVDPGRGALLPLTLPLVGWRMFTTLGWEQRLSWLGWTWVIALLLFAWRRRRGAAA